MAEPALPSRGPGLFGFNMWFLRDLAATLLNYMPIIVQDGGIPTWEASSARQ